MARFSKILGPDGQPINLDALFGPPKAAPTLTGVRSPISGHPADGLTPLRLAAIHRAAAHGDPLAYLELAEDIEERDMHYLGVLGTRRRQVAQLPVTVEAASEDAEHEKHADLVREWLAEGVLDAALFDMLDAIGKGFSITEIEWETDPRRVVPKRLTYRPQRWFGLDDLSLDEPMLYEGATKEPLSPYRFVIHRHPSKSGLTIRSGLARVASWGWMYKAFTLRDWAIFTQNYGQPIRVGRYGPGASREDIDVLWQAVGNIAGDCAAVVPKGMEIEFIQLQNVADGSALYEKRADWIDRQISKVVLGQTATTDAIAGGHAVGQEHRLVQEDLERSDAKLLSATVTQQLVHLMVAFTFGPQERYPKLLIGRPDELPISDVVDAVSKLGPLGLEVEESQLLDRLGFTEPAREANGKPVRMVGGRAKAAAPVPAAGIPSKTAPAGQPPALQQPAGGLTRHLLSLHASAPEPDYVDALSRRVAEEAAGALAGLTEEIRRAFDEASDMQDLAARLERMQLDPAAFAEAMQRGMALAFLTGQAALLDGLIQGG
ncbi:DUF935 domain-containing protein [Azorhizobium caulinodans]|uniref:DUF935 domain-containing protein n=1 Tax=Azorhizobium caulinodans TaxID=7 RepID=UPI002FBDAD55